MTSTGYIGRDSLNEVNAKGFSVYRYLSPKELVMTVQQDYLGLLIGSHYFFTAVTIIVGLFTYVSASYMHFAYYLLGAYGLIFIYLLIRLFYRTYIFFLVRNVVYTHEGLILGDRIVYYREDREFLPRLKRYAALFKEYLSKDSKLETDIAVKRLRLFTTLKQNFKSLSQAGELFEALDRFVMALFVLFAIHAATLVLFYFVGLVVGYLFFGLYGLLIGLVMSFSPSQALAIKKEVAAIDAGLKSLETRYEELKTKLSDFTGGEISDLSPFVAETFTRFYGTVDTVLQKQQRLARLIEHSKYREFIDFSKFAAYMKQAFNRPVHEMLALTEHAFGQVNAQLSELATLLEQPGLDGSEQLKLKQARLEMMLHQITKNRQRLSESLI